MNETSESRDFNGENDVGQWLGCGCLGLILLGFAGFIFLPTMMSSEGKIRQSEAKHTIGATLRGQQAYYLEEVTFAASLNELGLGIAEETENYRYEIEAETDRAIALAIPRRKGLKSYAGVVFAVKDGENTTVTIICESKSPRIFPPTLPKSPEKMVCPEGARNISP